jgi:chemotaxis protein CheD
MAIDTELRDVTLRPGEYAVAGSDCRIRTLLGSCVSITLWHPKLRVGAMSHFMLARRSPRIDGPLDARYGEESLQLMLDALARVHVFPAQCEAKIFGGGNMFPEHNPSSGSIHVGRDNGEAARQLLQSHGIHVVSESLFGVGHRQIAFEVASGHVWVRLVHPTSGFTPLMADTR